MLRRWIWPNVIFTLNQRKRKKKIWKLTKLSINGVRRKGEGDVYISSLLFYNFIDIKSGISMITLWNYCFLYIYAYNFENKIKLLGDEVPRPTNLRNDHKFINKNPPLVWDLLRRSKQNHENLYSYYEDHVCLTKIK